ncbi:MAG: hypothetical protein ACOC33_00160 [bacterium]
MKDLNEFNKRLKYIFEYKISEGSIDNPFDDDVIPDYKVVDIIDEDEEDNVGESEPKAKPNPEAKVKKNQFKSVENKPEQKVEKSTEKNNPTDKTDIILQMQVEMMKNLNDNINRIDKNVKDVEDMIKDLPSYLSELSTDIKSIKAPTDKEKLEAKKEYSGPYGQSVDDFWNDKNFKEGIFKSDNEYKMDLNKSYPPNEIEVRKSFYD